MVKKIKKAGFYIPLKKMLSKVFINYLFLYVNIKIHLEI